MISHRRIIACCAGVAVPLLMAASSALFAQSITIGLAGDITAFDPHYHNVGPNNASVGQVFEKLVGMDERQKLVPGLALSWKPIDDLNWEFKQRKGVK